MSEGYTRPADMTLAQLCALPLALEVSDETPIEAPGLGYFSWEDGAGLKWRLVWRDGWAKRPYFADARVDRYPGHSTSSETGG